MVERGETGLDAGKGYYDWSGQDPTAVRSEQDELLIRRTEQVMADWNAKKQELAFNICCGTGPGCQKRLGSLIFSRALATGA